MEIERTASTAAIYQGGSVAVNFETENLRTNTLKAREAQSKDQQPSSEEMQEKGLLTEALSEQEKEQIRSKEALKNGIVRKKNPGDEIMGIVLSVMDEPQMENFKVDVLTKQKEDKEKEEEEKQDVQARKMMEEINRRAKDIEAVFGIHEKTKRRTIKIVDKESKEVIKELPSEKILDSLAKIWEMAGIMVDEKR